jgi:hypothetical protein
MWQRIGFSPLWLGLAMIVGLLVLAVVLGLAKP